MPKQTEDGTFIESLPRITIPKTLIRALGLRCRDGQLQAVYFSPASTLIVNNGKSRRRIPARNSLGFRRWLNDQGIRVCETSAWLVVDVLNAVGYLLGPDPALATVQVQWQTKWFPLEDLFSNDDT
jgi:hypothetical protein